MIYLINIINNIIDLSPKIAPSESVIKKSVNVVKEIYEKYEQYEAIYGSDFSKVTNLALDRFLNDMMSKKNNGN